MFKQFVDNTMTDQQQLLLAAANSAQKIFNSLIIKRVERMKQGNHPDKHPYGEPTRLAHYTTADGLRGIVLNGNLWASGAYYLNDSSEIDYGCQLFDDILTKVIAEEGRDPVSKSIFEEAKKAFAPGGSMQSIISRTYVACFCEKENLLSQWRTYGQDGGYAINFTLKELRGSITVSDCYHTELHRVIYDRQIQTHLLQLVLHDLISILNTEDVRQLWKSYGPEEQYLFSVSFNTFLQTLALNEIVRIKDPAFEAESEWRLIARPMSRELNDQEIQHLKFRTSRGMAVPYVELRPKKGTLLPIESARYGPTLERKRVVNSLELLFKQKGYSEIQFHGSEIPVIF